MARLFLQRDTSFVTVVIKDCVEKWALLTEAERDRVISILKEERKDSRWLRAVALTRESVPAELQAILLGTGRFLDLDPREIAQRMPRQLLEDCVAVTTGHPGILDYIGLSSGIGRKWSDIRNFFLEDSSDPLFDIAVRELFREEKADAIQGLYGEKFTTSPDKFFLHLFESGFRINSAAFLKTWAYALLNAPDPGKYEEWITLIANNIESLEAKTEIIPDIGDSKIMQDILCRLSSDRLIYLLLITVYSLKDPPEDIFKDCCGTLKAVYEQGNPRILYINDLVENFARKRCKSDPELLSLTKKARYAIVDNIESKSPFENSVWDDHELDGWVHQGKAQ